MISADAVNKFLKNKDLSVKVFDVIDSTNAEAKRYAMETSDVTHPVLFVAKEQSAGRGRMGRHFLSRLECGIYMSLLYYTRGLSDAVNVTTAAAVSVALGIETVTGNPMLIKWVNDIYNDKGKVCGILAESLRVGNRYAVVVGIGINVGDVSFPEELQGIASTIGEVNGEESRLIARIADSLLEYALDPSDRSYMADYRARFMLQDVLVDLYRADEKVASGRVLGVDDDGGLIFLPDGEKVPTVIRSGEVSVRKLKKDG